MPTNIVEKPQEIYQIKVTLLGTDPPIWRRLLIPADLTLEQLHDVLQSAMGWEGCHLMSSVSGSRGLANLIRWSKPLVGRARPANEPPACSQYWAGRGQRPCTPMTSAIAGITKSWSKNAWRPKRGELILPAWRAKGMDRLKNCGGLPGFYNLLEAIADSGHEQHEELVDWLGDDFDPEAFSVDEVNQRLAPLQRRRRKAATARN